MIDPNQALQELLKLGGGGVSQFPPNSRYHTTGATTMETGDGRTVVYLRRRFAPQPSVFALLLEHAVVEGDRLDNLAAHYFGDPELFWRICDANAAMRPEALTEAVGRRLRITLPEGIPGQPGL
jgi:hypothetical protein